MSYEGYEEFICTNGHYWTEDAMTFSYGTEEEQATACKCNYCKEPYHYARSVDETNGIIEEDIRTQRARLIEIGFDNVWHEDHLGNKYATKELKYKIFNPSDWNVNPDLPIKYRRGC